MKNYLDLNDLRALHNSEKLQVNLPSETHTLRHLETGEYICLKHANCEYVACFDDWNDASEFRNKLGLVEHVDIVEMPFAELPFDNYWLKGEMIKNTSRGHSVIHSRSIR